MSARARAYARALAVQRTNQKRHVVAPPPPPMFAGVGKRPLVLVPPPAKPPISVLAPETELSLREGVLELFTAKARSLAR